MDEATLTRLLVERGPDFPVVARALAELPDGDPLKDLADQVSAPAIPGVPQVDTVSSRLDDLEARIAALEA